VVIAGDADTRTAVEVMRLGAVDFLEQPVTPHRVIEQVRIAQKQDDLRRAAHEHRQHLSQALAAMSPRERHVLERLFEGDSNKQIAIELGISEKTISCHRASILQKTGTDSLVSLVRLFCAPAEPSFL
jgi:RNA polymerase sigma factor (sigma-70 family)